GKELLRPSALIVRVSNLIDVIEHYANPFSHASSFGAVYSPGKRNDLPIQHGSHAYSEYLLMLLTLSRAAGALGQCNCPATIVLSRPLRWARPLPNIWTGSAVRRRQPPDMVHDIA